MDIKEFESILNNGENNTVEFKSWVRAKNFKELVNLATDELIAFANAKGGTVFMGVEDSGVVTGCFNYDVQNFIEAIYDKTRPPLFVEHEEIEFQGKKVIALSVSCDGHRYATNDGRCLKRLGKNSKPYYPEEMSNRFDNSQNFTDFSGKIMVKTSINDINKLEVYNLKEKLKVRDPKSTLPFSKDLPFLRDLGLLVNDNGEEKLTVAGLLFVGKEQSLKTLLPQHEVIYLHYSSDNLEEYDARLDLKLPIVSILDRLTEKIQNENKLINLQIGLFRLEIHDFSEKVFQEALLNALAHRDYENMASVYVKHYPDKIVIENPGGFIGGVTTDNIITHPSVPRNKLIADTLHNLRYVQRTGQGVDIIFRETISMGKPYPQYHPFSDAIKLTINSATEDLEFVKFIVQEQETHQQLLPLAELMIMRYLSEHKRIKLSSAQKLTQCNTDDTKKSLNNLARLGLIETIGKDYMLTAKVYEAIKPDVAFIQDHAIRYIKAKAMILEYLKSNDFITNEKIQVLCNFSKQQARTTIDKMRKENLLILVGAARNTKYILASNT